LIIILRAIHFNHLNAAFY